MSSSAPVEDTSPAPEAVGPALLGKRVRAVEQVTEMAAAGAAKLLGHVQQMDAALEQMTRGLELLPDAARVNLLRERMGSLQAMLDWLTTRSEAGKNRGFSEVQTRLSMSRDRLADIQAEIQQAATVARRLTETREMLSRLLEGVETLESTQGKAEALLREARELSTELEHRIDTPEDVKIRG